ncbi:MAG: 16S rRNA (uracil(1498)-N(3))-methyltransferase [Woeseiaceae bacterium]
MPRTRLHITESVDENAAVELDADKARYLSRVLRLQVGDVVAVFDGLGSEYSATITAIGKSKASLCINARSESVTESSLRVHLVQGISRGERMDFVVQKATELGVKRISPVLTEFGVVKLDAARAGKRRDHWQKVAASACEQSGRVRLPLIDTPVALNHWFGSKPTQVDTEIILQPGAPTPLVRVDRPETKVCVLVGPEGGFSNIEMEDAEVAGFSPVSLGPRVLRTETAAVAALSVLQALWGDLR